MSSTVLKMLKKRYRLLLGREQTNAQKKHGETHKDERVDKDNQM